MSSKPILQALVAALVVTSATDASANDGIVGGIVGGIIGGVIANEANRNRTQQKTVQRAPQSSVSSATREANRETQTALNYFGFNAGTVDGVVGRGTRTAMATYQAHLGYPATGTLTQFERDFLLTSYQRAIAGGATTAQLIATNPMGAKGLLTMFRDQSLGIAPQAPGMLTAAPPQAGVLAVAPAAPAPGFPTVVAPAPAFPSVTAAAPAPAPVPAPALPALGATATVAAAPALPSFGAAQPAAAPGLPNFGASQSADASLSSYCNRVNLETTSNGGFVTVATMTSPKQALEEQFCLARTYVQRTGEELAARLPGVTTEQIAEQCRAFAPVLQSQIAALSAQPMAAVLQSVSAVVPQTGMSPAQLADTARICLSSGYRTDDMNVAVGSALMLAALGERGYAELLGHHLSQGFGATARPDLALDWYDAGLEAGAAPVIAPGQPERSELVRQAAYAFGGRTAPAAAPVPAAAPAPVALPSFTVTTTP